MAEFYNFVCNVSSCKHTEQLDHSDIKLLTTKVTEDKARKQRAFQWTIFTCPKCKSTQVASTGHPMYGKGSIVYIAPPKYEVK